MRITEGLRMAITWPCAGYAYVRPNIDTISSSKYSIVQMCAVIFFGFEM